MNKIKTKSLTLLSLFIAIEILMATIPFLGFIPIGPLRATTLHIPVIIAGILLGKEKGAFVGFVFGLCSLWTATTSPTITSFVFSPFLSGSFFSILIALIPRMAIGYVAGFLFSKLRNMNLSFAFIVSSFIGAITNTILVMGGIYFLFAKEYAFTLNMTLDELLPYFITIITTQGLLEAIVGTIISVMVCKVLIKIVK